MQTTGVKDVVVNDGDLSVSLTDGYTVNEDISRLISFSPLVFDIQDSVIINVEVNQRVVDMKDSLITKLRSVDNYSVEIQGSLVGFDTDTPKVQFA